MNQRRKALHSYVRARLRDDLAVRHREFTHKEKGGFYVRDNEHRHLG